MALGLSQQVLAFRAGIHRTYLSQLERGIKSPTLPVIVRIAASLGVRAGELVDRASVVSDEGNVNSTGAIV